MLVIYYIKGDERMCNERKVHITSYFVCQECNNEMYLPRVPGEMRKRGHIKDIYCPYCKKTTKFKEMGTDGFIKNLDGEII